MIQATFLIKNNQIVEYGVVGHANYAPIGSDIVCAAVSSLAITITNELLDINAIVEDMTNVKLIEVNEKTDALTQALFNGVTAIAEQYPRYVEVTIRDG